MSTCTPFGTYTNEPPDHAAVLSAPNLLSSGILAEPYANASTMSLGFAGQGQYQDTGAKMIHLAPHTRSRSSRLARCSLPHSARTSLRRR